ncbi:hypothetical protein Zmor_008926 [Zophobas morio]|jgi:hypothetical protein|uniref:Uncharacterized protein n=1 Tax=Zophobas morio TaxID=2755281 RepID=A0AA38HH88_9CUCU|nr:hypothetical protein Zmor_008926 [Zophobas morio]
MLKGGEQQLVGKTSYVWVRPIIDELYLVVGNLVVLDSSFYIQADTCWPAKSFLIGCTLAIVNLRDSTCKVILECEERNVFSYDLELSGFRRRRPLFSALSAFVLLISIF